MRATVYDAASMCLMAGSAFFFYQAIAFLAQKDYVAGVIGFAIGFLVIRMGVEVGKLAVMISREGTS